MRRYYRSMLPSWKNLSDPIFTHAVERPDQPALVEGPAVLTYADVAALVDKASRFITSLGIGPGDRVGICLTARADHVVLLYALLRVGAQVTELAASARPDAALLRQLGIGQVFVEPDAAPSIIALTKIDTNWREVLADSGGGERYSTPDDAVATVTLSSGTTGIPKGIVLTHGQHFARYRATTETFTADGVFAYGKALPFLLVASLSNAGFFRYVICQIASGGAVVLVPEYRHAVDLAVAVLNQGEAVLTANANMARAFLAIAPASGLLFPRLKALISIGQPLYADEKRALAARVTPNFYDKYGATGIGGIACLAPHEVAAHAASVGRAVPGVEIEIVDRNGAALPSGAVGRLRCRSVTAAQGFVADAGSIDEGIVDGWHYPGELASLDAEGYVHIAGRAADLIRRGDSEFFPPAIEAVIAEHPAILEVAVAARAAAGGGAEIIAFVVLKKSVPERELMRHCASRLPQERRPDRIVVLAAMPKLAGGKTDRTRLKTGDFKPIARQDAPGKRA
jgi:long-chain acyl-CoA synthetase